jgi:hypothetical protein
VAGKLRRQAIQVSATENYVVAAPQQLYQHGEEECVRFQNPELHEKWMPQPAAVDRRVAAVEDDLTPARFARYDCYLMPALRQIPGEIVDETFEATPEIRPIRGIRNRDSH